MRRFALPALFLVWLLLLPATVSAGAPEISDEDRRAIHEAQAAMESGDAAGGVRILSDHIEKSPKALHPLVFHVLGDAFYRNGRIQKAYDAFQQGLKIDPENGDLCRNLARTAFDLKRFSEAGRLLERTFDLTGGNDPELLYESGAVFCKAGAWADARKVLRRLVRLWKVPKAEWTELLLHTLLESEDYAAAERLLTDGLNRNPTDPEDWNLLARLRLRIGKPRDAAAALEIAYAAADPEPAAWRELADLYLSMDLPLSALKSLEKMHPEDPDPAVCKEMAAISLRAGRADLAIRHLDRAILHSPGAALYLEKGKILYSTGDWKGAIEAFGECRRMAPEDGAAAFYMGHAALRAGDFKRAREAFVSAADTPVYQDRALAALESLSAADSPFKAAENR